MTDQQRPTSTTGPAPEEQRYPQATAHTWGEFPVIAVEMGGYSDITAVDPYTGRRLWLGGANGADATPYDALRRLIDAMEAQGFLDS